MRRVLRENALCLLGACVGASVIAWLGLIAFVWNDYETESLPAVNDLLAGHLGRFLTAAPVYGGSLLERAPFAFMPGLWGGGALAVYRLFALPALLASVALAVWLCTDMRSDGHGRLARAVAVGICVANPLTVVALEIGHAEELWGGCLCVAALLLACAPSPSRRRAALSGVLLGLAVANKQWALLALGPVLLALPGRRRTVCFAAALVVGSLFELPLLLAGGAGGVSGARALTLPGSTIFQPWQLLWFFGHHGHTVIGPFGEAKPGYRVAPAWVGAFSHPAALLAGLAVPAWLAVRGRGARLGAERAAAALALALLARCMLDIWDLAYYMLPAMLALVTWEVKRRPTRPPAITLAVTALAWLGFRWLPSHASPDVESIFFLAWTLPLTGVLIRSLAAREASDGTPHETKVSSFGSPVRISLPSSLRTARSSIRTPSVSGR